MLGDSAKLGVRYKNPSADFERFDGPVIHEANHVALADPKELGGILNRPRLACNVLR